ncbi:MAG: branched-chain amino acid aminotransferase [Sphingomonadales bacterium]
MSLIPFDDRDGLIWFDGELIDWRDAKLHVLSHAIHYASGVFEGQRSYNGEIFKLEQHTKRLIRSAGIMDFEIPYTAEEINRACRDVLAANDLSDAYVRPVAWRGAEQMGVAAQQTRIHLAIACWPWPAYFGPEAKMKGLKLDISEWRRPSPRCAPTNAKAAGLYMICTLSKHRAEAKGCDDALMYDSRGRIAETTGANIFFLKDGALHTPTPDCFLNGITRRTVIDLARNHGVEIVERAIMPEEMADFEEAFITGTAVEVTPISQIGPHSFTVGNLVKTLMQDYDDLVHRRK